MPNYNGIKFFNEIIEKDWNKRDLTSIYESLREENELKDIDFSPLHEYIVSQGMESFYQ